MALFALALQLVLSFGHIHREDIFGAAGSSAVATAELPAADFSGPPTHHPGKHADDICAICAAIHLLRSSLVPEAPLLLLTFASQAIEHSDRLAVAVIAPRRAPFQSRAPPLA